MSEVFFFKELLFCCLGVDGFSHPSPAIPTGSNFDSLFKQFSSFIFGSKENSGQVPSAEPLAVSGYQVSHYFEELTVQTHYS